MKTISSCEPACRILHNSHALLEEYGDAIQEIDYSVGRIFDTLQQLGIDDNTIVIYAAENGRGPGRAPQQKIRRNEYNNAFFCHGSQGALAAVRWRQWKL